MSSTNRGSSRIQNDAYYTPQPLADALVRLLPIVVGDYCLEPHVGGGAFLRALRRETGMVDICDMDGEVISQYPSPSPGTYAYCGDFLTYKPKQSYDWIVGNPPYRNAQDHIEHAIDLLDQSGSLCFLLRLGFLESKTRQSFWKKHPLNRLFVLSERPSFTDHGTDSATYGFFWWQPDSRWPCATEIISWKD